MEYSTEAGTHDLTRRTLPPERAPTQAAIWNVALGTAEPWQNPSAANGAAIGARLFRPFDRTHRYRLVVKRCIDIGVSACALLLLSPLMLVIATLVFIEDPGPVLFRQLRYTRGARLFRVYKFRTMRRRPSTDDQTQTRRDDPRVTRVGRFLRRTSLDELPQLFNVLAGDMSLVGPRAHATIMRIGDKHYHEVFPHYYDRLAVLPGITGWAQVNGNRGIVDSIDKAHDRLTKDLYYISHWSLGLDFLILLRTIPTLITARGAF